ncbi:neuropilin and tolloid-like protein 1 [Aplysia californica]|uniref:Neuropilin and tolloid-like protein 1 n=1 Tax=Aplysia californica TaxID=6500 RepID=A0ABM0JIW9_APLCA|nr:neuropilin and tolloid-like protein 1 [Aplysia californica]
MVVSNGPIIGVSSRKFLYFVIVAAGLLLAGTKSLDYSLLYMESACGTTITFTESFQMDSSTGITYKNLLDCELTVTGPSGHFVVAQITRFELEAALTGSCTDYLDVHDGTSTSATKLNSSPVCGSGTSIPSNFTSSGDSMTLHLLSDSSGVYTGFNMVFVAATSEPCSSSQLNCNTSVCIPSSLECDGFDQCGDSTDEQDCAAKASSDGPDVVMIVLITLTVLVVIGCVVAFVAYRIYDRNRWKKFLHGKMDDDDGIVAPGPSYPLTYQYYKGIRGHPVYQANSSHYTDVEKDTTTTMTDSGHSFDNKAQSSVST